MFIFAEERQWSSPSLGVTISEVQIAAPQSTIHSRIAEDNQFTVHSVQLSAASLRNNGLERSRHILANNM